MSGDTNKCDFDLFDESLQEDPYLQLDAIRESCPLAFSEKNGGHWIVSRFDDVRDVLRDTRLFSSRQPAIGPLASYGKEDWDAPPNLTRLDPPLHGRYRKIVAPLFSQKRVEGLQSAAEVLAAELLDAFDSDRFEFMEAFAIPYTCRLFLGLMGIPIQDLIFILEQRDAILHPSLFEAGERISRARDASMALLSYVDGLVSSRPASGFTRHHDGTPADLDLLDTLRTARFEDGSQLTSRDIAALATQILLAGIDTTATALGNLVTRFATDVSLRELAWSAPELGRVVEEGLRLEPLIYGARLVTESCVVAGTTVGEGAVLLLTGAANRDPRKYEEASCFRPDRSNLTDHLSFGFGVHKCLGMHLARMELRTAIEAIRRRWAAFEIPPGESEVRHFGNVAGVYRLPLTITQRS